MMLMTGPTQAKLFAYLVVIMAGSGLKSAHKGKDYIQCKGTAMHRQRAYMTNDKVRRLHFTNMEQILAPIIILFVNCQFLLPAKQVDTWMCRRSGLKRRPHYCNFLVLLFRAVTCTFPKICDCSVFFIIFKNFLSTVYFKLVYKI